MDPRGIPQPKTNQPGLAISYGIDTSQVVTVAGFLGNPSTVEPHISWGSGRRPCCCCSEVAGGACRDALGSMERSRGMETCQLERYYIIFFDLKYFDTPKKSSTFLLLESDRDTPNQKVNLSIYITTKTCFLADNILFFGPCQLWYSFMHGLTHFFETFDPFSLTGKEPGSNRSAVKGCLWIGVHNPSGLEVEAFGEVFLPLVIYERKGIIIIIVIIPRDQSYRWDNQKRPSEQVPCFSKGRDLFIKNSWELTKISWLLR